MPEPEIEIRGADNLAALSKRLKKAAEKGLQKELRKSINDALKPLRKALPKSARVVLPKAGGYNERMAKIKFTVSRKNSSRMTGLRLTAKGEYVLFKADDPGEIKHTVFYQGKPGEKKVWVKQKIRPGWASKPFKELAPTARVEIEAGMERVINQIEGGSGA